VPFVANCFMPIFTRDELRKQLKQSDIKPLYLLFGEETYLRDQAARAITENVLRDAPLREFNETSFSLASTDIQQAIAAAEQLPMMFSRRIVKISDFNKLRETDEEVLMRYLVRPAESSVVIFIASDLDKRKKLSKALLDSCVAVEFAPLKDSELKEWAKKRLSELKIVVDERTLGHIVALVGSDVRTLTNEIEKLATAAIDSGRITMEMVDSLVSRSRELSNFELADQLVAKNRTRALQILKQILDDGTEPVMLLGLIASSYHRLALTKELMSRGASREEVFRLVPTPLFKRDDFLATARRADAKHLSKSLERIAAADLAIKTSLATPRLQLEMLVCELTQ
jgi:DNA polymerase-3 subunit delta